MKTFSLSLLADTVVSRRKALKITQAQLAGMTGIHRGLISRLESQDYTPSIEQLRALGEALGFEPTDMFVESRGAEPIAVESPYRIAIAGMGYVGLSLAVLLSQRNKVTVVDVLQDKVDALNGGNSPIRDELIQQFFPLLNFSSYIFFWYLPYFFH